MTVPAACAYPATFQRGADDADRVHLTVGGVAWACRPADTPAKQLMRRFPGGGQGVAFRFRKDTLVLVVVDAVDRTVRSFDIKLQPDQVSALDTITGTQARSAFHPTGAEEERH